MSYMPNQRGGIQGLSPVYIHALKQLTFPLLPFWISRTPCGWNRIINIQDRAYCICLRRDIYVLFSRRVFFTRYHTSANSITPLVTRFMGPTWGPSGADRTQVGPMLAPWTLLSGTFHWKDLTEMRTHMRVSDCLLLCTPLDVYICKLDC